jgi:O-antigen ligase
LVFVTTAYIAAQADMWPRLVKVFIGMILVTALFRWGEGVFFGKIGAWTGTKAMTQNIYGLIFSTFCPYLLVPLMSKTGRRWLMVSVVVIVWGAVAINGSRGAYVSVAAGVVGFLLLCLRAQPGRVMSLIWLFMVGGVFAAALMLAPGAVTEQVSSRFDTFYDLDRDKSFNSRKVLTQKGWRMFLDSPLVGAGVGNFRKVVVKLDLDEELGDATQLSLNRKSSHNSYVTWLGETGLAGSIPLLLLLLNLLFRGYKSAISLARREQIWALGVYVSFLMMSLHLTVLGGLTNTGTWVNYGLVVGMIITAGQATRDNNLQGQARSGLEI